MKLHQALCNTAESTESVQTKHFVLAPLVIVFVTLDNLFVVLGSKFVAFLLMDMSWLILFTLYFNSFLGYRLKESHTHICC